MRKSGTSACGFTLIELLVVLVILIVFAILVMAGVRSAKERGDAAVCTSNLRELAGANLRHVAENSGQFCNAQERDNLVRWHGVRPSISEPFDPSQGALAPYLANEGRIKLCPGFRDALKTDSFELDTGGYGYNAIYVGGTPADRYTAEMLVSIPRPHQTIMFTDTAMSKRNGLQEYAYAEPFQWVRTSGRLAGRLSPSVHFRHQGKANVAWCDGHVTQEVYSRLGTISYYGGNDVKAKIGWFGPAKENGFWNPEFDPLSVD